MSVDSKKQHATLTHRPVLLDYPRQPVVVALLQFAVAFQQTKITNG